MPLPTSRVRQLIDLCDKMSARLDEMEAQRQARWDSEDRERDITNPLDAPPNAPFSDSPPSQIHGEGREDQVESPWPPKPHVPITIENFVGASQCA